MTTSSDDRRTDNNTRTADTQAVRQTLEKVYTAWANNDADAFAALYADDVTVVMPGTFLAGRSAVRDYMAAAFAGPLKDSRAVDDPQEIRIINGDSAIIVSKAGIVMAGQDRVPTEGEVLATWVLSRIDGDWLIASYTNVPAH
jgi:uncharacterized protein (TIGR02246 family)